MKKKLLIICIMMTRTVFADSINVIIPIVPDINTVQQKRIEESRIQGDRTQEYQQEFTNSLAASMRVSSGQAKDYKEAVEIQKDLRDSSRFKDNTNQVYYIEGIQ